MEYTLSTRELIKRPIIRNDYAFEFENKMSDEEYKQFEKEIENNLLEEGTPEKFPDWNSAWLAKIIDRQILYDLFKLSDEE